MLDINLPQFSDGVLDALRALGFVIDDDKRTAQIKGRIAITAMPGGCQKHRS